MSEQAKNSLLSFAAIKRAKASSECQGGERAYERRDTEQRSYR